MLAGLLDSIYGGISIGAVLLIAALGLAIVFGLMGVINLAHGELMMLGAYTTFVVQNAFKPLGEPWFATYILFAVPIAFLVTALVGLVLERGVIRYLYGRPLETLLATWGVSLILQQFVRSVNWVMIIGIALFVVLFFGALWVLSKRADFQGIRNWAVPILCVLSLGIAFVSGKFLGETFKLAVTKPWFGTQGVDVTAPAWLRGGWLVELSGGSFQLSYVRLFIIGLTILCVAGVYLFLQRSAWGLRIRAVTQNRSMSACLGIPTAKVDAITFAIGSGLAGVAGCAISLLGSVSPNTGQNYVVDTFMVVVVGGVGKLAGTIVAALAIGTVNYLIGSGILALTFAPIKPLLDFFTFFATTSMAKVMIFALIIAFLQVRPGGIFPQKGRSYEL
ncbi:MULTISPECIES: urea ABC transporter permease subunit UrtB [unclassified Coleofasciculus]|uniref:urea ABC transporter permease subunit UrtB n=1 Tax=unclassified Coleofasciculus TaxID=2692782 RepID=UPI00188030B9|nr:MULTISPECIES: urea ABC transporter permease subunit UrtB [unclassified Coleofasciculus]MBE9127335.1 urea ABC transporter permease subunit UrtB [Coleofasciculus sp. LEGE 07081]MBE9150905.1 urea ABC transporter permease subunit UrtB [Coleofasciculus sp. LEGE 07092]